MDAIDNMSESPGHSYHCREEGLPTLKPSGTLMAENTKERSCPTLPQPLWTVIEETPECQGRGVVLSPEGQAHPMQGTEEEGASLKQSPTSTAGRREVQARTRLPQRIPRQNAQLKNGEGGLTGEVGGHTMTSKVSFQPVHDAPAEYKQENLDRLLQRTQLLKNGNVQLLAEKESLLQEKKRLQEKIVAVQREAIMLRSALFASRKDIDMLKAALDQGQAEHVTLSRDKEEAEQALLLLRESLSEERRTCEETEEMEVQQSQRAEKQKSPSCFASIWKWMRGKKKNNDFQLSPLHVLPAQNVKPRRVFLFSINVAIRY